MSQQAVDFGFTRVAEDAKQPMVNEVFASVASRYDLMNDLMSAGIHRAWKDRFVDMLRPSPHQRLLDLAGGTGDISFRFLARGGGHVTITDINPAMLAEGQRRALDQGLRANIAWQVENAEALSFADASFEAVTIAFGIRNVTHIDRVLQEAHRVLVPGGHFLCLEFSHPSLPWLASLYDRYSFRIIPAIGERVANDRASYQYLVESIRKFPKPDAFERMFKEAGFAHTKVTPMTGGVVAIHSGWKI
jgi:demethylmenaquinone methyltransferase/2-methoxy-6-polyprenyl-1,4-benzoquinol methylase